MIKGIFYSLLASVLFNCIYYMSVLMNPISTQALIGYRMIFAMPFVIAAIFLLKQQRNFKFLLLKIKLKPKILLVLLATSLIVSFQMWLYLWAPSNGAALKVSIGYLIMPIVMVLFGRIFFKEHLSKTKLASIFFAALGVFSTAVISGGISWESAVLQPCKFLKLCYRDNFYVFIFILFCAHSRYGLRNEPKSKHLLSAHLAWCYQRHSPHRPDPLKHARADKCTRFAYIF